MASFEHERLYERLVQVDAAPDDGEALSSWLTGEAHLRLLLEDVKNDELIVAAMLASPGCMVNTLIVRADDTRLQDPEALLKWSPNPYDFSAAEYYWTWSGDRTRAEPRDATNSSQARADTSCLVFGRNIEGLSDETGNYLEVLQTYVHQVPTYWRPERRAYSRFDHLGDWEDVISLTQKGKGRNIALASFRRQELDLHLIARESVLARSFTFNLLRPTFDPSLLERPAAPRFVRPTDDLFYRMIANGDDYCQIRGVQIIRPKLSEREAHYLARTDHLPTEDEAPPVEFLVQDMRDGTVVKVSTDPATTRTYFKADRDDLPYETSPAFFRPEVLAKYTADRDKYTLQGGGINCRGAWSLQSYSINDAEQVAVYICYLRDLPREEQVYWSSFNERPKAGLSARTIQADFHAELPDETTPLEDIIEVLDRWRSSDPEWWTWVTEGEPSRRLTVPHTDNRDEWAEAFLTLYQAVIEGFSVKALRRRLQQAEQSFGEDEQSIKLLERLLHAAGRLDADEQLKTLREIRNLRVHAKAHATGRQGRELATAALTKHGSYAAHYEWVCSELVRELALIEDAMG